MFGNVYCQAKAYTFVYKLIPWLPLYKTYNAGNIIVKCYFNPFWHHIQTCFNALIGTDNFVATMLQIFIAYLRKGSTSHKNAFWCIWHRQLCGNSKNCSFNNNTCNLYLKTYCHSFALHIFIVICCRNVVNVRGLTLSLI